MAEFCRGSYVLDRDSERLGVITDPGEEGRWMVWFNPWDTIESMPEAALRPVTVHAPSGEIEVHWKDEADVDDDALAAAVQAAGGEYQALVSAVASYFEVEYDAAAVLVAKLGQMVAQ